MATLKERLAESYESNRILLEANVTLQAELVAAGKETDRIQVLSNEACSELEQQCTTNEQLREGNNGLTDKLHILEQGMKDGVTKYDAKAKQFDMYYKLHNEITTELGQIHNIMDLLGCPIPKRFKDTYLDVSLTSRLVGLMTCLPKLPVPEKDEDF